VDLTVICHGELRNLTKCYVEFTEFSMETCGPY